MEKKEREETKKERGREEKQDPQLTFLATPLKAMERKTRTVTTYLTVFPYILHSSFFFVFLPGFRLSVTANRKSQFFLLLCIQEHCYPAKKLTRTCNCSILIRAGRLTDR